MNSRKQRVKLRRHLLAGWLLASQTGLGLGCSSLTASMLQPTVELEKVRVARAGFADADLLFDFNVQNPNSMALNVDRVKYNLTVDGKPVTNGQLEKGLKVGPQSTVTVPVPVSFRYSDLGQSLSSLWAQGLTPYEIQGEIEVGILKVPFRQKGELKMSDLTR